MNNNTRLKDILKMLLCKLIMFITGRKLLYVLIIVFGNITTGYTQILPGSYSIDQYVPIIKNKKVALVANHTSLVKGVHLVDTLISMGISVVKIFSPEHGFRGEAEAGQKLKNEVDSRTGIKIISLYGKHFKPTVADMRGVEVVVFDIQDVGVRCYTYLSTLHYVMESCAENNILLIVLDRPNPNGFYIDGPVMQSKYYSFVGLHPVPLVYGMTIGEYALMINGEGWLKNGLKCSLKVITCINYTHNTKVTLSIAPSPNLTTMQAIYLYPSLVFFEGTVISVGRGTPHPFTCFGHPLFTIGDFYFTPRSIKNRSLPLYVDTLCRGIDLSQNTFNDTSTFLTIRWLIFAYHHFPEKDKFFNRFFPYLDGSGKLKHQIEMGMSESDIRNSWHEPIENFKKIRRKYLLYP